MLVSCGVKVSFSGTLLNAEEIVGLGNVSGGSGSVSSGKTFYIRKKLVYRLAWNGIPVGSVTVWNGGISTYRGREVYTLRLVTESNKFLSAIYRVEDKYTSYVATDTMSSMRYEADRKEGRYKKHVIVEYAFDSMEAVYTSITDGSVKRCPIYENPHDPVSAICYFLTSDISSGETLDMVVNLNEKNYVVHVDVGEKKKIKVPAMEERECFKVTPRTELDGIEVKKGRAWGYISADEEKYPLYGVVRIPFGTVTATLVSIEDI